MRAITCYINLFDASQQIDIIDGEEKITLFAAMEDVPFTIIENAKARGIADVKISKGPYAENIKNTLFALTAVNYSGLPLNVELV